jgi:hypothetical protein
VAAPFDILPITGGSLLRHAGSAAKKDVLQMRTVCNHNGIRDDPQSPFRVPQHRRHNGGRSTAATMAGAAALPTNEPKENP